MFVREAQGGGGLCWVAWAKSHDTDVQNRHYGGIMIDLVDILVYLLLWRDDLLYSRVKYMQLATQDISRTGVTWNYTNIRQYVKQNKN